MNETDKKLRAVQTDWDEVEEKVRQHKKRRNKRLILGAIIVGIVLFCIFIFRQVKTYNAYRIVETIDRSDSQVVKYTTFRGNSVRYSTEGVTCTDSTNKSVWSLAFDMENPIATVKNNYIAFGDIDGKKIYVTDEDGRSKNFTTDMPIKKISVADNGTVAVLMQEGTYLGVYSKNGKKIAEGAIHSSSSGYPLDVAISPSGEKMARRNCNI